jgi:hypothetical protein
MQAVELASGTKDQLAVGNSKRTGELEQALIDSQLLSLKMRQIGEPTGNQKRTFPDGPRKGPSSPMKFPDGQAKIGLWAAWWQIRGAKFPLSKGAKSLPQKRTQRELGRQYQRGVAESAVGRRRCRGGGPNRHPKSALKVNFANTCEACRDGGASP